MAEPKYPDVHVRLTGRDGNAFAIMGAVAAEIRRAHGHDAAEAYAAAAQESESYDALLQHAMRTVVVS